jgi:hypothetical protein
MTTVPGAAAGASRDGLATASLICGIASFVPLSPPVVTPVAAIVLGLLARRCADPAAPHRSCSRATTGMVLGGLSLVGLAIICIVYFGVLGYPLPTLHRYHPDS